jgi:thiamine biosynthesis protein ThiI
MDALIAHYHEVSLKGRNREFFEATLARNLKRAVRGTGYRRLRRGLGRITIDFHPGASVAEAAARGARVFGVANLGLGRRTAQDLDAIADAVLELLGDRPFGSFAVRARRTYAQIEARSSEINRIIGQRIVDRTAAPVDLSNPDTTVHIELFGKTCIVYRDRIEGPGGLPVGVSGRMMALLSGGIDSPVAAYRMALRGAEVEFVHFHGEPFTDRSSIRQAHELVEILTRYQLHSHIHLVPLADVQREIVMHAPASMRVVLYRRAMLRIASALGAQRGAQALITGDSLGQVASQTVENLHTVSEAVPGAQLFRPLIGMDKREIIDLAQRIGTFEVSTRKYQDCCVIFEARSPVTRARPEEAEKAEADLDFDALVGKALAGTQSHEVELPPP